MTRTIQLIATGMVTFTPGSVPNPQSIPELTFVMMDNPSRRASLNDTGINIVKHQAFVLGHRDNIPVNTSNRPLELVNLQGWGGWLLDKERLTLDRDPAAGVTFDPSISQIADLRILNSSGLMDPRYATITPPAPGPVAAQFVLNSGVVSGGGVQKSVQFRTVAEPSTQPITISNEVHIELKTEDASITFNANALFTGEELDPLRFEFAEGQERMTIYFGSAPASVLQAVPNGKIAAAHSQDVDFELFYDITNGGPPAQQPIPIYSAGGPVPGSERCPPLQNGG